MLDIKIVVLIATELFVRSIEIFLTFVLGILLMFFYRLNAGSPKAIDHLAGRLNGIHDELALKSIRLCRCLVVSSIGTLPCLNKTINGVIIIIVAFGCDDLAILRCGHFG